MDFEGTSDVYIRSFFNPDQDYTTDTHYRCQTGAASFNWRKNIPLKSKQGEYILTVQAWDWDLIGSNSIIGECQVDLSPLISDSVLTDKVQSMSYNYFENHYK
jgi:Ca2+-dependent lipid-binding protein